MDGHPKILITGATSGLGRELAQQLADQGNHILATGRRQSRLETLSEHEWIEGQVLDLNDQTAVSYTHLTLPTTPYV